MIDDRGLLDDLPVGILVIDREGVVVRASAGSRRLAGWTSEQLVGRRVGDLLPPRTREHWRHAFRQFRTGERSLLEGRSLTVAVQRSDGRETRVELLLKRVGESFVVVARSAETDSVRQFLTRLHEADEVVPSELTQLLHAVALPFEPRAAVLLGDTASRIGERRFMAGWTDGTAAAEELVAATRRGDVPVPAPGAELDPGERGPDGLEALEGATPVWYPLSVGDRRIGVVGFFGLPGSEAELWIDAQMNRYGAEVARLVDRQLGSTRTLTEKERLRLALRAGALGVWTWDPAHGRVEWSPELEEIYGYEPGGFPGTYDAYLERIHPEDREAASSAAEVSFREGHLHHTLHRVIAPSGELRWVEGWGTPVIDQRGRTVAMTGVSRDVTEEKVREDRARARAAATSGLLELSRAALQVRGLDQLVERLAEVGAGLVGAESGVAVLECGDPDLPPRFVRGVGSQLGQLCELSCEALRLRALSTGPVLVGDSQGATGRTVTGELLGGAPGEGIRSLLAVSVSGGTTEVSGGIVFTHPEPRRFGETEQQMAGAIAAVAGLAARSELRNEQQRRAAQAFQRSLLPPGEVTVPRLEVCVRYHPGRDGLDVGGDWYDVLQLEEGRVAMTVGDVCGHGIEAAADMGRFRHGLRAMLLAGTGPTEAFRALNRTAHEGTSTTVTIAYVELDPATGRLRYWSCGHLPPIVASPDGSETRWLDATRAPMLGFRPDVAPSPAEDELAVGETLLLYTDGLIERRGESIGAGMDRLAGAFVDRGPTVANVCDELYELLAEFGPDADDSALVGVRRLPDRA